MGLLARFEDSLDRMVNGAFAKAFKAHVCVVAHPTKSAKDADGNYKMPTLYDIAGSANFYNKADLGVVVPRDAGDQQRALPEVGLADARPGDLYFFARAGRPAHHVGVVTAPMRMVHAPETGAVVTEEDVSPVRRATLVGAARPLP